MPQSRTLRLTKDRLAELTPAEMDQVAGGSKLTTPTQCLNCIISPWINDTLLCK